jgi:pilus assembly protein CpaC
MGKIILRAVTLITLIILGHALTGYAEDIIQVVAGRQKTIEVGNPVDILMSDSRVATLDYTGGTKGVLVGQSPGTTSLTLRYTGGREVTRTIQVLARDPRQVNTELKELLSPIKGLTFREAGDRPVVEGRIALPEDADLFNRVMPLFPDAINLVKVQVRQTMIGVSVKVLEADLSRTQDYKPLGSDGVGVSGSYSAGNGGLERNVAVSLTTQLLPKLEFWLGSGAAQLVADPVLTTVNRAKAHLQIGGEVPYEFSTAQGMSVEWKNYGIILTVTPEWLASEEVLLALIAEVSSPDDSRQTARGIPGMKSRRIESTVAVKNGESVVMSGLKYRENSVFRKRLPVLGYLLPFLFYQKTVREEEKELVFIVTPTMPAVIDRDDYSKLKNIRSR